MKLIKKVAALLLVSVITVGSIFATNTGETYAATSYKQKLSAGKTYKINLDGDNDQDSIKQYISKGNVYLKVNNTVKKLISDYSSEYQDYTVKIYDLNKKDKSLDIVLVHSIEDYTETKILKFQNGVCKLNKTYSDATFKSYDSSNGMVTMESLHGGRYSYFSKSLGSFYCYERTRINGYNAYNQYTANTTSGVRKNKYVAAKTLTAYRSTSGKTKKFTVSKGSKVNVYAFYQKGSTRYLKVRNSKGVEGYIKASSSLLFTENSCLWFR